MPLTRKSQKQAKSITITEQALFDDNLLGKNKDLGLKQKSQNKDNKLRKDSNQAQGSGQQKQQFSAISDLLSNHPIKESNKYISQEFQAFGCHMATVLEDQAYTSLYIKLAKTYPRAILEQALAFVSDAQNARSKAKLFMWKLDQLRKEKTAKQIKTAGEKKQKL